MNSSNGNFVNDKTLVDTISKSQQDMDDMKLNLSKLRNLNLEDKSEMGLLKSRIEEQSHLIMTLKNRSDENLMRVRTLERINAELEEFRDNVGEKLRREMDKSSLLEQRFQELANNHEEMIRFKNQYKSQVEQLRLELEHVQTTASEAQSKAVTESARCQALHERQLRDLQDRLIQQEAAAQLVQSELTNREASLQFELKKLTESSSNSVTRLKKVEEQLLISEKRATETEAELGKRVDELQKEKEELLQLAMSRGRLVTDKCAEIANITLRADNAEKRLRIIEQRHAAQAADVDANLTVRQLRNNLEALRNQLAEEQRLHEAFKNHSGELLQRERELNARLRNNIG